MFDGCYWHNHNGCSLNTEKDEVKKLEREDRHQKVDFYLMETLGYDVERIWEFEWLEIREHLLSTEDFKIIIQD